MFWNLKHSRENKARTSASVFIALICNYVTVKDSRKLTVNNRILFQLMDNPYFQTKVEGIKTNS